MTSPVFSQIAFRARNDDGSETGATWKANQGVNWTQAADTNFRVRFRIDETASRAWTSKVWNLYYNRNGAGYAAAGAGTPVIFSLSGNFADGADCTAQLTGGTGTFVTDNNGMKEASGGATNSGTAGYLFEVEFCIQLVGASLNHADTIELRIYDGTGALGSYDSTPSITASVTRAGILSKTLGDLTKTIDGDVAVAGSLSKALGDLTKTVDGDVLVDGDLGKTLEAASLEADGTVSAGGVPGRVIVSWIEFQVPQGIVLGVLDKTLDGISKTIDGDVAIAGALDKALDALSKSIDGDVTVDGDATNTIGGATLSSAGTVGYTGISGSLDKTLDELSKTIDGDVAVAGSLSKTLGDLSKVIDGDVGNNGSLAKTLEGASLSAAGVVTSGITGSLSKTLGDVSKTLDGDVLVDGDLDKSLNGISLASAATVTVTGVTTATLAAVSLAAMGAIPAAGSLDKTLADLALAAIGGGAVDLTSLFRDMPRRQPRRMIIHE